MQLAADPVFCLRPPELAAANARRWQRALTISLAFHGLVLGAVVQRQLLSPQDAPAALPPLSVVLMKALPVPTASPAPAAEEPRRPQAVRPYRQADVRVPSAAPAVLTAPPDSSTAAPVATVSAPTAELPPAMPLNSVAVAQTPQTPVAPPPPRTAATDPGALAGYNRALAAAVDRHKRYPRIALMRQWQGTVVLQLNIGSDGRLQDHHLARSSGYDALDQQALEMLREALPLPPLPAQLAGMMLSVDIPVTFRIAD